ncbi:CDP-4-dehydro-6-deoxyglucose reductase, E1, partial [Candidatus Hakubella thermalkaliphila]
MTSGTLIPGQVVVIEVPVRNGSFEREHSALVLRSPDTSGELLAALIFNQDAVYGSDLDAIVIEDSDFEGEGLGRTSVVRAQQTLVIHRSAVKRIVGMLQPRAFSAVIRCRISLDVKLFYEVFHDARRFDPARDRVPYAGRVFDEKEVQAAVDAALDFWLTLGPHGDRFQKTLAEFLG